MFFVFPFHPLHAWAAISDAQSLRAGETQSMKWLTELRCDGAMNHSFEFIVVKRNRMRRSWSLNTVQQAVRDKRFESCRSTFAARRDPWTRSQRREVLEVVPIVRAAGKNIVVMIHPTINASCHCRMTERSSLFFAGARQSGPTIPSF
jgi:hypothetical protein